MQVEDDRGRGPSRPADIQTPTVETDTAATGARSELMKLIARLTEVESDLVALKTSMSIIATLTDRVRCAEFDLRELSGTLRRGSSRYNDVLGPLSYSVSHPVAFKSS